MRLTLLIAAIFCLVKTTDAQVNLIIKFDHQLNPKNLSLTKWKYYINNIQLTGNHPFTFSDPILVDAFTMDSVLLSPPEGQYQSIEFFVGIDSLTNIKGIQEGVLDPINGMYWTWNTGYINWKVEGRMKADDSMVRLTHHIGGFAHPFNASRKVRIVFDQPLSLQGLKNTRILIDVNLNAYLELTADLKTIMEPGAEAMQVADAIPSTFRLRQVSTE